MQRANGLRVLASAIWLLLPACSKPDYTGTPLNRPNGNGLAPASTSGTTSTSTTCSGPTALKPMDPSTLPACTSCTDGQAHCVPTADVPGAVAAQLSTCSSGGYCVPDVFIKSGGAAPPTCKSLNNADGVCLSVCVPQVAMYKTLLPQATCASDERCAPCINPLTNMASGACDIGKPSAGGTSCSSTAADGGLPVGTPPAGTCPHTGPPVIDPSTLPACGDGGAHCISASLVPPAMASELASCPTGLCAPDVAIAAGGQFIPPTCMSIKNNEGRCLNDNIPQVEQQSSLLPQSSCQSYERCVPCSSPLDGKDTGACKQSCDPGPSTPPIPFQDCCTLANQTGTFGKCVPQTAIPGALQTYLKQDKCTTTGELCVPTENVTPGFTPKPCTAFNLFEGGTYTGVCLSSCLNFGLQQLGIARGDCDKQHECVPCTRNGAPTGAPGCPGTGGDGGSPVDGGVRD
jgi:hypothetical protein